MKNTDRNHITSHVSFKVNGITRETEVEHRLTLADCLRNNLKLTGTHVGCEHGACGSCTVLVDNRARRSCLTLAIQVDGASIQTVEGLADANGELHPLQQAFHENHGLQCGFCTPGLLMTLIEFLSENPSPSEDEVREAISGNLCRCTGYQSIVASAIQGASALRQAK